MLFAKRNLLCLFVVMLIAVGHPLAAKALSLELSPSFQSVGLGTNAQVDVWLRDPGAYLSAYDISLTYNPAILAYSATTFSSALGNPTDPSNYFYATPGNGSLEVVGFPLAFDTTLQTGTADLLLFTLNFSTLSAGTSTLNFASDPLYLGDEFGNPLVATLGTGSITVTQTITPVPEPGTVLLLGAGLLGVLYLRRKNS